MYSINHSRSQKTIDAHASIGTIAVPGKAPVKNAGYPTRIPISFDQNKSAILSPADASTMTVFDIIYCRFPIGNSTKEADPPICSPFLVKTVALSTDVISPDMLVDRTSTLYAMEYTPSAGTIKCVGDVYPCTTAMDHPCGTFAKRVFSNMMY